MYVILQYDGHLLTIIYRILIIFNGKTVLHIFTVILRSSAIQLFTVILQYPSGNFAASALTVFLQFFFLQ